MLFRSVVRLETYRKTYGDEQFSPAETKAHLTLALAEEKRTWARLVWAMGVCPAETWENPEQILKATGHGPVKMNRIAQENFPV